MLKTRVLFSCHFKRYLLGFDHKNDFLMKRIILSLLPVVALFAFAQQASAMVSELPFRTAAQSVYGDAECGSILMTANPQFLATETLFYPSALKRPNTSACIVLASYLRSANAALVSHEVVATESAELTNPYQFESKVLPALQKEKHDMTTSTVLTWTPVDPRETTSTAVNASSTWTLKDGTTRSVHTHGDAATTTAKDGTVVNTYDMIDHVTNLKNTSGLVYRAQKGNEWYVVRTDAVAMTSRAWKSVDQLTVDETTSSTYVLYRAQSADEMWHIVLNDKVYDFPWKPMNVSLNPVTHEPFAGDATGRFWTPKGGWVYPSSPRVQGVDSKGRFLVTTLSYPDMDLKELWVNNVRINIFTIANQYHEAAPSFTNERAVSVYFPGYVQTFDANISFNEKDEVVIYRQEGRVFTRSAYQVK